jgi:hypothetical protein
MGTLMDSRSFGYLLIVAALLALVATCQEADAVQHNYAATWNANPPTDLVNVYNLRAFDDQGVEIHHGEITVDPPGATEPSPRYQFDLDRPVGSTFTVTVDACNETQCSVPSDPVQVTVPAIDINVPTGITIEVNVTVTTP